MKRTLLAVFLIPIALACCFIAGQLSRQSEINTLKEQALDDRETIQELLDYSYNIQTVVPCDTDTDCESKNGGR